ncbi:MAG: GTP-binding protein [Spirochaetaceae bacterium]|nr:MAG: GTP-binding protein [Spirochaetaceae bacterium]TVR56233.1 MAG: GTP-binding protein [Spirochaetaceae bacterium]
MNDITATDKRTPVTILTGFLGSGKTTLLNRILSENHGKRIAVIENEFGEVGIDHELVIQADEEVFEMNNGCICCTVRGDLIRILGKLMKRRDKLDYILIETTGLADPGPVIQTFYMDDEIAHQLRVDGCVTLVDTVNIDRQLDEASEASEQIAFADVILLNKTDLASAEDVRKVEDRLRRMNARATIHRTAHAELPLERILDIGGFDLNGALDVDPKFLEPEYPFEWAGVYQLEAGEYELVVSGGPDPTMDLALLSAGGNRAGDAIDEFVESAVRIFSDDHWPAFDGTALVPAPRLYRLRLSQDLHRMSISIARSGPYTLFTEHLPEEFDLRIANGANEPVTPSMEREFKPDHEHNDQVTSVGITIAGDLEIEKIDRWLTVLIRERGLDIFRMKGVLAVAGYDRRFVFQGVHMLMDSQPGAPWQASEARSNALVFIGRNLDRTELETGFRRCLA